MLVPAQQVNLLDSTGADRLAKLQAELDGKGITLAFAEVKHAVQEKMRQTGLEAKIGINHFHRSIDDGVQAFCERQQGK